MTRRPNLPDLPMLERWLSGWCLARGVPLPCRQGAGLVVEVGQPDQLRRHVFVDAGAALQECAGSIHQSRIFLKATVDPAVLRAALPPRWQMESVRSFMRCDEPLPDAAVPAGYSAMVTRVFGADVISFMDSAGKLAASGKLVVHGGSAIFDQIETTPAHQRRGLGRAMMAALDRLARQAGVRERLLVATGQGRALYTQLGWETVAPYSTAVLPDVLAGHLPNALRDGALQWRQGSDTQLALFRQALPRSP